MEIRKYSIVRILVWLAWPAAICILLALMFLTCGGKTAKTENDGDTILSKKGFRLPDISGTLILPEQRAAYLATHYWDHFGFCDTAYIHLPEITEQAFADYLAVLPHTDKQTACASIKGMLTRMAGEDPTKTMYAYFLNLYKDYLYDPDSPVREEEFYIPVAEYILSDTISGEAVKSRARFDLDMMLKNRKGSMATDFGYVTAGGGKGSLYTLKKDYTLLYFYNPDCTACRETTDYMRSSPLLNRLLEDGRLDILALYPDEDTTLWREHASEISPLWINVRDEPRRLKDKLVYDLKAIPTLYLLDKQKRVQLKDADATVVERYMTGDHNPEIPRGKRMEP